MILLSFDTEEFDVPQEHGVRFTLEEGMKVSTVGLSRILDCLRTNHICATFFCTGNFAEKAPDIIKSIFNDGHEVACHGVDHGVPKDTDIQQSKEIIEHIIGKPVSGYRQPRMFPADDRELERCGYSYDSSLNPAFIPGRYMHLFSPRTYYMKGNLMEIPSSVTPWLRFPLFWLSLHNLPESFYQRMVLRVLKHDGYFVTYFHPWEFYDLKEHPEFKLPFIIKNHSGEQMVHRLNNLIRFLKSHHYEFITYSQFYQRMTKTR